MGLRIPDNVAVLGVNNYRWNSILAACPVSSIQLNLEQLGLVAARMLDGLLKGEQPESPQWVLPRGVISRRSTDMTHLNDPVVTRVMAFIRDHCDQGLSVDDLLEQVTVSRRNLEQRMKSSVGLTPQKAIFRGQIEHAKTLLVESQMTVEAIAMACGFDQAARLHQLFKRLTGVTPGQYRQQYYRDSL